MSVSTILYFIQDGADLRNSVAECNNVSKHNKTRDKKYSVDKQRVCRIIKVEQQYSAKTKQILCRIHA